MTTGDDHTQPWPDDDPERTPPQRSDRQLTVATLSVSEAVIYACERLRTSLWTWLGITLLLMIVSGLSSAVVATVYESVLTDPGSGLGGYLLISIVDNVIVGVIMAIWVNGALLEVSGRRPSFGDFFRVPIGALVSAAAVVAVPLVLLFLLIDIPTLRAESDPGRAVVVMLLGAVVVALVGSILLVFAPFAAIDRPKGPVSAATESARLVAGNPGRTLLLLVVPGIVLIAAISLAFFLATIGPMSLVVVGALLVFVVCLCGTPVVSIMLAYGYRALSGGTVAR